MKSHGWKRCQPIQRTGGQLPEQSTKEMSAVVETAEPVLTKISRQSIIVFLTRAVAVLLGIGSTFLLARILGPSGFGKFRLGSVVVQLVTGFCILGLDRALLRYLPALETRAESGRGLLIRAGSIVFVISVALSILLFANAYLVATLVFHSREMAGVIRFFSLQIPVLAAFRFFSGAVTASKRFDYASKITNILSPTIFVVPLILLFVVHPSIYGTISARIVGQFVAVACLALFLLRRYPNVTQNGPAAPGTFKSYVMLSVPLFMIGLGYQLLHQMDTLMLGYFSSQKDVGIYSVALKISAFVLIGIEIMLPIVSPLFSQFCETRDRQSMEGLFNTSTKWLSYAGLVIFTCIAIFREEVLHVFGKGFVGGSTVLLILSAGQLVNAATGPTGALLTMTGKQKWELANTGVMVGINFLLNLLLIPRMGMTGAAIATATSIALINSAKLIQVYLLFGIRAYDWRFLKGLIAVGTAAAVAYAFRLWLENFGCGPYTVMPVGGMAFLITAGTAFWLLGLDQEDKLALVALRRR